MARCTWHWLWLLIEVCTAALHLLHLLTVCIAYSALLSNYYCYFYYCICSGSSRQMVCYWGIGGRVMVTQTCSIIGRMCQ